MSAFLWDIRIIIFGIVIAWVVFGIVFRMVPSIVWFISIVWMMVFIIIIFRRRSSLFFRFLFWFFTFRAFRIGFGTFSWPRKPSAIENVGWQGDCPTGNLLDFQLNLKTLNYWAEREINWNDLPHRRWQAEQELLELSLSQFQHHLLIISNLRY